MPAFPTHPGAFSLPRSSAPDIRISPPDAHIDAAVSTLAQSQGFQHYGRPEAEDLTLRFKALVEARGNGSLRTRACEYQALLSYACHKLNLYFPVYTLFDDPSTNDWERNFGTAFLNASDETVDRICESFSLQISDMVDVRLMGG